MKSVKKIKLKKQNNKIKNKNIPDPHPWSYLVFQSYLEWIPAHNNPSESRFRYLYEKRKRGRGRGRAILRGKN
jgi:hypothetical protein